MLDSIFNLVGGALDKIFPDKDKANEAKLKMLELQQSGQFKELELAYDAIKTEAASGDKWTSRARPAFMYVFYIMLLAGIPMGIVYSISPGVADGIIQGFKSWFEAIPDEIYWLFGSGYLGYTTARTYEKKRGLTK